MFREALGYPRRGGRWIDTVAIGGGLHLLAVFLPVVPFVFVLGYLVGVLGATAAGEGSRPGFRPVWPLVRDGVVASVIILAYLAVPLVLLTVTILVAASGTDVTDGLESALVFQIGSTVTLILALAFAFPIPAALAAYATGGIRRAFDRRLLHRAVSDGGYFYAFVVGIVALAVAFASYEPLNTVALGFFVAFYLEVVVAALWGRALASTV